MSEFGKSKCEALFREMEILQNIFDKYENAFIRMRLAFFGIVAGTFYISIKSELVYFVFMSILIGLIFWVLEYISWVRRVYQYIIRWRIVRSYLNRAMHMEESSLKSYEQFARNNDIAIMDLSNKFGPKPCKSESRPPFFHIELVYTYLMVPVVVSLVVLLSNVLMIN